MQNYVQPGDTLKVTAPYDLASGAGCLVGGIFGVAFDAADYDAGDEVVIKRTGVFTLAKTSAQAWTQGQRIYWDNSNKRCDSDGSVGIFIGLATEAAANPSSTGTLVLVAASPLLEGTQAAVVALTDSTGGSGTHDDTLADGLTAEAPAAITNYTAHASGSTPVTSNAATDLDTTAAALATLENEVTALRATVAACVTDLGVQNQNDSDLAQKILEIRTVLVTAGLITA